MRKEKQYTIDVEKLKGAGRRVFDAWVAAGIVTEVEPLSLEEMALEEIETKPKPKLTLKLKERPMKKVHGVEDSGNQRKIRTCLMKGEEKLIANIVDESGIDRAIVQRILDDGMRGVKHRKIGKRVWYRHYDTEVTAAPKQKERKSKPNKLMTKANARAREILKQNPYLNWYDARKRAFSELKGKVSKTSDEVISVEPKEQDVVDKADDFPLSQQDWKSVVDALKSMDYKGNGSFSPRDAESVNIGEVKWHKLVVYVLSNQEKIKKLLNLKGKVSIENGGIVVR